MKFFEYFTLPATVVKNAKGKDTYESLLSSQFTVTNILMIFEQRNNRDETVLLDS